eukprot:TRINITY_DN47714_c0_g1_i1.p1 TRINITY_DN47714_c0_g1~~TRINITY_DN47714_c0_g1_i1.p1  ORF type:complete len:811 (-),score=57.85 TRINITY_DN47714_c0_g1_i1:120-2552(-)
MKRRIDTKRQGDVKRHPLEVDALLGYFNWIFKVKDKLHEKSLLLNVPFPETIIYEHHFPRGWFIHDGNGNITKRSAKDCDTTSIFESFANNKNCDIVASFCYKNEDEGGEGNLQVEFLDVKDLGAFLLKPPEKGVLQKFLLPNGKHNDGMWITWTPFIFFSERWQNKHLLNDSRVAVNDRARVLSVVHCNAVCCAPRIVQKIKDFCHQFVAECYRVEKKVVTKMLLHFKLDKQMHIWLLRAPQITIGDAQYMKFDMDDPNVKLNDGAILKQLKLKGLNNGPIKMDLTKKEKRWYKTHGIPTDFSGFKSLKEAQERKAKYAELMKEQNPLVIGRQLSRLMGDSKDSAEPISGEEGDETSPGTQSPHSPSSPFSPTPISQAAVAEAAGIVPRSQQQEKRNSPSPKKSATPKKSPSETAASPAGKKGLTPTEKLRKQERSKKGKAQSMMSHAELLADISAPFRNQIITPGNILATAASQRSLFGAAAADFLDSPASRPAIMQKMTGPVANVPASLVGHSQRIPKKQKSPSPPGTPTAGGREGSSISYSSSMMMREDSLVPESPSSASMLPRMSAFHLKRSQAYVKIQEQHRLRSEVPDKNLLKLAQNMGIDIGTKHVQVDIQEGQKLSGSFAVQGDDSFSDLYDSDDSSAADRDEERLLLGGLDDRQQATYQSIKATHKHLNDYMADLAYKAYSHILETNTPFTFSLPTEIADTVVDEELLTELEISQLDDNLYQMEVSKGTSLVILTKRLKELSNAVASTLVHQRKELLLQADQLGIGMPSVNSASFYHRPSTTWSSSHSPSFSLSVSESTF